MNNAEKPYHFIVKHLDHWWIAWSFIFIAGLIITQKDVLGDLFGIGDNWHFKPYKIIFGLLSIPALWGLVRSKLCAHSELLLTFGKYTFAIYLMNTMAIGFIKALLSRIAPWDGINFYWYAPILLSAGIFLPIFAKKHIFKRLTYLDKITN